MLSSAEGRLVARVAYLVNVLRYLLPHYGAAPLRLEDVRLLKAVFRVGTDRRASHRVLGPVTPHEGEAARLRITPGVSPTLEWFCTLRILLGLFVRKGVDARATIHLTALCGILGGEDDEELVEGCLWRVEPSPGWSLEHLPHYLRLRQDVLAGVGECSVVESARPLSIGAHLYSAVQAARANGDFAAAKLFARVLERFAASRGDDRLRALA
jgi:hypothetical protein